LLLLSVGMNVKLYVKCRSMLSLDVKNVFLVGGAAVAAVAAAYVVWGPSEKKHKRGSRRGNACIMYL